jgi:hypothetical protein
VTFVLYRFLPEKIMATIITMAAQNISAFNVNQNVRVAILSLIVKVTERKVYPGNVR